MTRSSPNAEVASIGDFHCHSNASDGVLTPAELVNLAASRGVRILALTDHDTTDGLAEAHDAASRHPTLTVVPGLELSCDVPGTEVHMLGLFIDHESSELQRRLSEMRTDRVSRAQRITEQLASLDAAIAWADVEEIAGEASVGRPHVARALMKAGHVASIEEAFERFLAHGRPAYVARKRLDPADAIEMIRAAGGLPIFAHPPFSANYVTHARELAARGLFGMEVFYRHYDRDTIEHLRLLATELGLFTSGGSDFHAFDRVEERAPGQIPLPDAVVEDLIQRARDLGCYVPEGALEDR